MSDTSWSHRVQHDRLPCPSPSPGACSNSYLLSWWYHPTTSSSVVPFFSCLQSFPASGSFLMSHFFASGGQSIGVSASTSVLPMNTQDWSPLGWTGWIFSKSKGLSRVFSSTIIWKHQFFGAQPSLWPNSHIHTWLLEKTQLWLYKHFSAKWCLCFLILCLVCHSFPSKEQTSFNFMDAVTIHSDFRAQEEEICHYFHFFLFYLPWSNGAGYRVL